MLCFTTLGEHDALKSDKPTSPKVMQRRGKIPTYDANRSSSLSHRLQGQHDANRCRHITLTCRPLGSWNAVCYYGLVNMML